MHIFLRNNLLLNYIFFETNNFFKRLQMLYSKLCLHDAHLISCWRRQHGTKGTQLESKCGGQKAKEREQGNMLVDVHAGMQEDGMRREYVQCRDAVGKEANSWELIVQKQKKLKLS
jgi:hypothetical protein